MLADELDYVLGVDTHRDRVRSEACFARLAGVAPIPASSGQTRRHRLSRGGDRQLNRALHTIILHRELRVGLVGETVEHRERVAVPGTD